MELVIWPEFEKYRYYEGEKRSGLETLALLPRLQDINLFIMRLTPQCLPTVLKKNHALFTSASIESVTINFDLEIAARYFTSTQVKELTSITTNL